MNPLLNAFITIAGIEAKKAAKDAETAVIRGEELGPLHGIPISVKDNLFTKNIRTTFGSRIYEGFIPNEDDASVKKLKDAGAIIIGKTNLPEFGARTVTINSISGTTVNPWKRDRTAGGSSGGAAAAVASGMGPMAVGTDAGGSTRIPGSFCGVYGIKPQFGRVARGPGLRPLRDLVHTCPMTRTVRDAALMLDIMAGPDDHDSLSLPPKNVSYLGSLNQDLRGFRIAWSPDLGYVPVEKEVLKATSRAVQTFADMECRIEEVKINFEGSEEIFSTIARAEWYASFGDKLNKFKNILDPRFVEVLEKGREITVGQYLRAQRLRSDFFEKVMQIFEKCNLLITPTVSIVAFSKDIEDPREIEGEKIISPKGWHLFSHPFSLTGQPAATVPCGFNVEGLPIGLQIVGRRFDEISVLNASAAFEEVAPWGRFIPEISPGSP